MDLVKHNTDNANDENDSYKWIYIPGSSKCVKCVPFQAKNQPKGRIFTYLEDPGIYTLVIPPSKDAIHHSFLGVHPS